MTDLFKAKAKDWDENARRTQLASAIGSSILEHVSLNKEMTVLDFGAGTGLITGQIAPLVNRVVAADTSKAMLDKLASKPELKDKVDIFCQDLLENPLDAKFDLIVSAMAMHHVQDTSRLIETFAEHLNDSGIVALADLDKEDGSFHPAGTQGVFHSGFDRDDLRAILQSRGFEQIAFFTAHIVNGDQKDYPIFLVTARKA
ncbi:MAG: class I SAM-dependent methyltransferase [Gammaproteobacteria bacterium]|nr:class I SAM-dependent methyltransferase [Gammaproteobacteria bacterium]